MLDTSDINVTRGQEAELMSMQVGEAVCTPLILGAGSFYCGSVVQDKHAKAKT